MTKTVSVAELQQQQKIYGVMQKILKDPRSKVSQEVMSKLITTADDLKILRDLGYMVQPLSTVQPTLRAVLYNLLYGRMDSGMFDRMIVSFKNMQERYVSDKDVMFVHLFTEGQFDSFVQLATKVEIIEGSDREETISFNCLFTDASDLGVNQLKVLRSSKELENPQRLPPVFRNDRCYLLSVLTREVSGEQEELVRDYLLYIPTKYIEGFE